MGANRRKTRERTAKGNMENIPEDLEHVGVTWEKCASVAGDRSRWRQSRCCPVCRAAQQELSQVEL